MSEEIKAHIISHTHWDREWFLNSRYTNEWLVPFFDSLFEMLEKEEKYRFVLDGQTLMIEDYFAELEKQGKDSSHYKEKLKKYVQAGQLIVGPYYLQPDWQLLSEESLVRNLLIGHKMAADLGAVMETGWLLDNFGQISQTAQIHKKFGLKGLFLWRGVEMDPEDINSEFLWRSPDGTEMLSIYLLSSYRNAMRLAEYKEIMQERIENETRKIYPFATTSNVLLMNGYDQEMLPDNILPELNNITFPDIKVKQSTPMEYIEAINRENPELKVLKGVLYSGRFISVFPGILSARMYLKLMNDTCQRELESYAEPFSVLSWLNGGEYEDETLLASWKTLLKNHPHDSICGVSIDDVHTDMEKRFAEVLSLIRGLTDKKLKELTLNVDTTCNRYDVEPYLVFNSSLKKETRVINLKAEDKNYKVIDTEGKVLPCQKGNKDNLFVYLKDIPGAGYKTIYLEKKNGQEDLYSEQKEILPDKVKVNGNIINNKYLKVKINQDGSLDVFDKINKILYNKLGIFVDGADAGDEYNYSYPENDIEITSQNQKAEIKVVEAGPLKALVKISMVLQLPESLTGDRKTRCRKLRDFPIVNWISLEANSPVIVFKTDIKNTVKDHRLRVLFPTDIATEYSYAGTQFDITKHEIKPATFDNGNIPENVKRIIIGARESKPITTFPQRYFVDINNGDYGIALLNRGLPEYEILPENNTIALTLFRSVGWLARGDLLTRIGDAGPVIFTPDAQCLRQMSFEYALYFHQGDCWQGEVYEQAKRFNNGLKIVKTDQHKGDLEANHEFLNLDTENNSLQITACKRSEDGDGIILRLFNSSEKDEKGILTTAYNISSAYYVNLNEEVEKEIEIIEKNILSIKVGPKEIITLKLKLNRHDIILGREMGKVEILADKPSPEPDFSKFKSVPLVKKEDIIREKERWDGIEAKLKDARERLAQLEEKLERNPELDPVSLARLEAEFHKTKGAITTYERFALEARLSMVLTRKKYFETYNQDKPSYNKVMQEFDQNLREIGYALNQARVYKRVYEYIVEYYQHRLKLISEMKG